MAETTLLMSQCGLDCAGVVLAGVTGRLWLCQHGGGKAWSGRLPHRAQIFP